ncbi:energy transducer TonB [Chromobacterium alticapitis]|nr:energy transducer TonB [Chromobacterium alticapitis]
MALWLLNSAPSAARRITPPQLARMEMVTPAAAGPQAAAPSPQSRPADAKPSPAKPAPKTTAAPQEKSQPMPSAKAASLPAAPAAISPGEAPSAESQAVSPGKPAGSDKPQTISEPLAHGGYLNNPAPAYPAESQEDGEAGTVRLRVHVSAQGQPLDVTVQDSSGFPRLDRAARAAVKRWRFIPAKRGDEAIAYTFIVPVEFSLKSIRS